MRIERVVVNASPLIVLFKSGLADLLPQLFTDILVPVAVWSEVASGKDQAAIARHGDAVIPDIVRGMEELQLLTALADDDFIAQVAFSGSLDNFKVPAQQIY
ncbi:MAG: hypothetical protein ACRD63_14445, partial [Pyrinomonadaceae bacterium]